MTTYPCKAPEGLFIVANYPKPEFKPAQAFKVIPPEVIVMEVCGILDVPIRKVMSKLRERDVAFARQVLMTTFYYRLRWSFDKIGGFFNRDHSTVIHARDTIRNLVETNHQSTEVLQHIIPEVVEVWQKAKKIRSRVKQAA